MARAHAQASPSSSNPSSDTQLPEVALLHHGDTLFGPMREWQLRQKIPPVLLLTGQAGIGKRKVAHFLAQWALCQGRQQLLETDPKSLRPCNQCSACLKVLSGNEVDVTEITPDADETSGTLKIEQFRKMKASLGFGAHEGSYKIILIPHADRMTVQAANSVLKILEETPPGWLFFLTATDATLLLPTLVSRCQVLRLKPFSQAQIQQLLAPMVGDPERRKICATLGQGSWSRALAFANEEVWQQRRQLFQFLEDPASVLAALVDWAAQETSHFDILIDLLEQFTSELIRWSASAQASPEGRSEIQHPRNYPWGQSDGKSSFATHAERVARELGGVNSARNFWVTQAERLARALQESLVPLNRKLFIQDILMPWMGVRI